MTRRSGKLRDRTAASRHARRPHGTTPVTRTVSSNYPQRIRRVAAGRARRGNEPRRSRRATLASRRRALGAQPPCAQPSGKKAPGKKAPDAKAPDAKGPGAKALRAKIPRAQARRARATAADITVRQRQFPGPPARAAADRRPDRSGDAVAPAGLG